MRWAFSPLSSRSLVAASMGISLVLSEEAQAPAGEDPAGAGRLSGAVDTRGAGVLELLLGTEEGVEHGFAGVLAEDQGDGGADQAEQDDATELALLALLRRPEGLGGVAQVLCRNLEVTLHLLVAGDCL